MTDMTTSNEALGNPTQTPTNNSQPTVSTMKIVQNKTHLGPVAVSKRKDLSRLTKSANKIRISSNLKVEVASSSSEDFVQERKKGQNPSTSVSIQSSSSSIDAKEAILLMEAWERLLSGAGTEDYVQKSTTLFAMQRQAYESLGINPDASKKPELTEEQRSRYNAMVLPYAFDYYEVHLSYKVPQKRAVRSKTYRYTAVPDLDQIKRNLIREAEYLNNHLKITVKDN